MSTFYPTQEGWLSSTKHMSFQEYCKLTEAFDNPYNFNIDSSHRDFVTYKFKVDDVDEPYRVEAIFDSNDTLDQFIEPERDSAGIAKQNHRQAVQAADQYIASKYPNAIKPEYASVIEYAFSDADDGTVTKTGKSGYSSTRVIGTIIHIAQHYIISRQPHVLLFTGAKDENRGPIYTKLTHLAFKSLRNSSLEGYGYFIDDSDRHNVRFWIYKEDALPYLGDENFQKRMSNKWQQQNPGLDNVYE